ncbi:septal ring lytic transglycosylase RlpA family protein [Streptomyces sp. A3M-1-3]|uniref:septal ring lytic transglycosylase RlpA family protein n=1 Tax=Streptomyces sp. A3M-1-3 TaxID=2962044 RepID=UPI0020B8B211|nr:septal ring lytic transglycosylase RlpA family protein [Streptomyces sp. A3M-1-3]MCP3817478.1 septal ring lytic transglycosylase RlpA family protein [Streptomyces sp. A3M-1-3]
MSRKKTLSRKKKVVLLISAAALAGGTAIVMTGTSQASVACDGLATALSNNEKFIAGQRANPDAQSDARIANRQAVIEEIKRKQAASGCEVGEGGGEAAPEQPPEQQQPADPGEAAPPAEPTGEPTEAAPPAGGNEGGNEGGNQGGAAGEVVCAGSTVTLSGEGGAPAASSNQFPVGTQLKVTNLDNSKSTTVEVTSVSGSCALLNDAAFEQVREPGKFLIRKARIERVGQ